MSSAPIARPHRTTSEIEKSVGTWMRAVLPGGLAEALIVCLKFFWASLYGILLLTGLVVTKELWTDSAPIQRYDAMLIYAITLQGLFLWFRLETWAEARVIVLFHLTGTLMEIYKVNIGSWAYPDPGLLRVFDVPLFSGFMYAAVGSFIARSIRLFDMRFEPYPPLWLTGVLAAAIYANFYTHHFLPDIRVLLFAATVLIFGRTWVTFAYGARKRHAPFVLAIGATSGLVWIAENICTRTETWLYTGQVAGQMVPLSKMGSWYLLLYVSFVLVTLIYKEALVTNERPLNTALPAAE